jgi:hypothetical protein
MNKEEEQRRVQLHFKPTRYCMGGAGVSRTLFHVPTLRFKTKNSVTAGGAEVRTPSHAATSSRSSAIMNSRNSQSGAGVGVPAFKGLAIRLDSTVSVDFVLMKLRYIACTGNNTG